MISLIQGVSPVLPNGFLSAGPHNLASNIAVALTRPHNEFHD